MLLLLTVMLFINAIVAKISFEPYNKCNKIEKLFRNNEDCIYNPDEYLDVREKRGGQPVFLQHGLLGSSADWLMNGNNSLGFLLANNGYDVWLGNARGNTYSKGHISLPIDSRKYWNFSWHEMGTYDLPAVLYYVSNITEKPGEIIYIGHSMGTTMFFVISSTNPQAAKNVKLMVALAPVAYMTHIRSPIRYLAPFSSDFQWLARYLGINQFLPNNKIMEFLAYDCELFQIDKKICENIIFVLFGFDEKEFNQKMLPLVLKNEPAGTSTKTVVHYAQEIRNGGNFQAFDYGSDGNMIQYGTKIPPKYQINNIKRPVYMMYGENDWLASYEDVHQLSTNITNLVGLYKVELKSFNHIDFLLGKDAEQLVYQPLMKLLLNFTSN
ncbi:hypothetical protein NQ314_019889 [Rhamnusium bicolor]|uniref:Lipase n=1 Tax=Rhamnusium bicolor TaxID=1586634 RepID=A0AAV8WMI1_9CUCU|nr:hypothetical protein NQ314_019889 [Rhamnusium bicolor]